MARGNTSAYYAANPEAAEKRRRYQRKLNSEPKQIAYRSRLNKARRKRGLKGNPNDLSHDSKGNLSLESMKINRARNGHGNNKRYR